MKYEEPNMMVIIFEYSDVITDSNNGLNSGESSWDGQFGFGQ